MSAGDWGGFDMRASKGNVSHVPQFDVLPTDEAGGLGETLSSTPESQAPTPPVLVEEGMQSFAEFRKSRAPRMAL